LDARKGRGDYGARFVAAFDHIDVPEDVTIVEIANALAAFMAVEWQSIDSPFDRFLAGGQDALDPAQRRGLNLFYGEAGCSDCHSGPLLSDQKYHALGLPAFGPGRTRKFDLYARDVGRMGKSDRIEDAYAFRTPMLRNVALTAPYGHNGAYNTLQSIVRHHLDPVGMMARGDRRMLACPRSRGWRPTISLCSPTPARCSGWPGRSGSKNALWRSRQLWISSPS
jgi:cytochrome c peroxidase